MAQYSTQTDQLLNNNKNIYEVMYLANNANGSIVSTTNPLPAALYSVGGHVNQIGFDDNTVDAFGRLRISTPHTLFDSANRFDSDTMNWSTANTAGTTFDHNANTSSLSMNVSTANNVSVVRQTKRYLCYQPGKSQLVLETFTMQPKANVSQKVGYFDAGNGIYVENTGSTTQMVLRANTTGTVANTVVTQSNWNVDKFDGTGPSGITLDMSKSQIFWADIEWLGVGSVRTGFVIDGKFYLVHKFNHANQITKTYMSTATLPLRYEIVTTGVASSNTTLEQICSTVVSEGGFTRKVITNAISNDLAGVSLSATDYRPLVAIRLKAANVGNVVIPQLANLYGLQSTPFNYKILQNATVTNGTWVSAGPESCVEYNITATAVDGGVNLLQGMFIGGTNVQPVEVRFTEVAGDSYQLRVDLSGTMETFVLAAKATTINDDAIGAVTWVELN